MKFFVAIILVLLFIGLWFYRDNEEALAVYSETQMENRKVIKKKEKLIPLENKINIPNQQSPENDFQVNQDYKKESSSGSDPETYGHQGNHTEAGSYESSGNYSNDDTPSTVENNHDQSGFQEIDENVIKYQYQHLAYEEPETPPQDVIFNAGEDFFTNGEERDPASE